MRLPCHVHQQADIDQDPEAQNDTCVVGESRPQPKVHAHCEQQITDERNPYCLKVEWRIIVLEIVQYVADAADNYKHSENHDDDFQCFHARPRLGVVRPPAETTSFLAYVTAGVNATKMAPRDRIP